MLAVTYHNKIYNVLVEKTDQRPSQPPSPNQSAMDALPSVPLSTSAAEKPLFNVQQTYAAASEQTGTESATLPPSPINPTADTNAANAYLAADQAMIERGGAIKSGPVERMPLHNVRPPPNVSLSRFQLAQWIGKQQNSWFKTYFGVDENRDTIRSAIQEFNADMIVNDPETSLIDLRNISFKVNGIPFAVGDFSCLPLPELRKKAGDVSHFGKLTYEYIKGNISDIIKGITDEIVVVQAASQFNLLEMTSANVTPAEGIAGYVFDNTQGPRVALSSPAGTLFRNYAVWNGTSQIEKQINTLAVVMNELRLTLSGRNGSEPSKEGQYSYQNGYLYMYPSTTLGKTPDEIQAIMDQKLRVGIQWNTPSYYNPSIKLCQVYSSALPLGKYLIPEYGIPMIDNINAIKDEYYQLITPFAVALLASTFKCTLQAGVVQASHRGGRCTVYLTAVGGGVFGNPHEWIKEGLLIALEEFKDFPLDVKMVWWRDEPPQYGQKEFNKYPKPIATATLGGARRKQSTQHKKRKQNQSKPTRRIKR